MSVAATKAPAWKVEAPSGHPQPQSSIHPLCQGVKDTSLPEHGPLSTSTLKVQRTHPRFTYKAQSAAIAHGAMTHTKNLQTKGPPWDPSRLGTSKTYITVPLQHSQQKPRGPLLCKCREINVAFLREDLEMRTLGAVLMFPSAHLWSPRLG